MAFLSILISIFALDSLLSYTESHPVSLIAFSTTVPLLLLQTGNDPLQLASLLSLHGLQDLCRTLWLTAGGALPSQHLTVLQDKGMLVIPTGNKSAES